MNWRTSSTTPISTPPVMKYNIWRLAGSDSAKPKNPVKRLRPLEPPSSGRLTRKIAAAAASAWDRMAKYAPLTLRLNTR